MIVEVEGIVIAEDGTVCIVLVDDEEGTIELGMSSETFNQLRLSINRKHRSKM